MHSSHVKHPQTAVKLSSLATGLQLTLLQLQADPELIRDIQTHLGIGVDDIYGPQTERAIASFCQKNNLDNNKTGLFGATFAQKLLASVAPLKSILTDWHGGDKDATIHAIITESRRQGLTTPQIAYVLATTQHETAGSFQPVEEGYYLGSRSAAYQKSLRYYPFFGRGYVQLTWKDNYLAYSKKIGLDLVKNPALALRPDIALFVLVDGMKHGAFTGLSLTHYINANRCDWTKARRIINGMDCADKIALIARNWSKSKLLA